MSSQVYVDFDGTIMLNDTTDFLFERFALPQWRDVEEEWAAGRIGSRACMARQVDLLRVTPAALSAAIAELEMDQGFTTLLAVCQRHGLGATVVSDGLDAVIAAALERHGIEIPFFANRLMHAGGDRWRLEFPHAREACSTSAGHCKCARLDAHPDRFSVVVGDGRSDFCIAGRADLVLAKSKLIEECRSNGLPHLPFRDLTEAAVLLEGWLTAGSNPEPGKASVPLEA